MQETLTLPPGLEPLANSLDKSPGNQGRAVLAHEIRQAIASELDVKMEESLESIWQQGEEAAEKYSQQCRSFQEELSEKLSAMKEQEAEMEMENAKMRQLLATALEQLAHLSQVTANAALADFANLSLKGFPAPVLPTSLEALSTNAPVAPLLNFDVSPLTPSPAPHTFGGSPFDSVASSELLLWENAANMLKLPEVPAFPVAAPQPPSVPLSLVDALGLDDANSFKQVPSLSTSSAQQDQHDTASDGFVFSTLLQKPADGDLGLVTSAMGGHLRIDGVLPGSGADAWNQQCGSSGEVEKILSPGDAIVDVNGISSDAAAMEAEMAQQQMLRLMLVRSDGSDSNASEREAAVTGQPSTLRAEAQAFVPRAATCACI